MTRRLSLLTIAARAWVVVLLAGSSLPGFAGPPRSVPEVERTVLFSAGDKGVTLYRIPGVVVTAKGTLLAYCEARLNSREDWGEIEAHLKRSTDQGRTWSPARKIAHLGQRLPRNPVIQGDARYGSEGDQTVNCPVAVCDTKTKKVHMLYCIEYMRCFVITSDDDGMTFSAPREITRTFASWRKVYPWQVIATGPGHGIQLENGRLLVPVWLSDSSQSPHKPSVTAAIYSDDHGATWHAGRIAIPDKEPFVSPSEAAIVELADGTLMLNARNDSKPNRRVVATSRDRGTTWEGQRFDPGLNEPKCFGSLAVVPNSAPGTMSRVLFVNPNTLPIGSDGREIPAGRGERRNLTVRLSDDGGRTWKFSRTLEEGPSAYADLVCFNDQRVICFYEQGSNLVIARFGLDWVMDSPASQRRRE